MTENDPLTARLTRPREPVAHGNYGARPANARRVTFHVKVEEDWTESFLPPDADGVIAEVSGTRKAAADASYEISHPRRL